MSSHLQHLCHEGGDSSTNSLRYVRYVVDRRCVSQVDRIGNFNFEYGLATACQTPLRGT